MTIRWVTARAAGDQRETRTAPRSNAKITAAASSKEGSGQEKPEGNMGWARLLETEPRSAQHGLDLLGAEPCSRQMRISKHPSTDVVSHR
jgi:hypothetical protein